MIYCALMGGLGNQLFQIFATIAYALKNGHIFKFPDSKLFDTSKRPVYWSTLLSSLIDNTIGSPPPLLSLIYNESGFQYQEIPAIANTESINISGYYQSYKYFEDYYGKICDVLELNEKKNNVFSKFPKEYSSMISMHFRIGDYKHLADYHPVISYQYYKNALQFIMDNRADISSDFKVLYFCEEENNEEVCIIIDRLAAEFPGLQFIKGEDSALDYEQLLMMSLCNHNIIANSTFSWFSAYLNNNKNKIVCYPSIWFGPALSNYIMDDLCPNSWTKISASTH